MDATGCLPINGICIGNNQVKGRGRRNCYLPSHLQVITYQYQITQFMTGHANFQPHLYNLSCVANAHSNCRNGTDNARHLICYCREWNEQRKEFRTLAVKT